MFTRKNISLAVLFVLIALTPALINMTPDLIGTDDRAEAVIKEIDTSYVRWVEPFWRPQNKTTETLLFVFQAAIGAGFIFYYITRKRKKGRQ